MTPALRPSLPHRRPHLAILTAGALLAATIIAVQPVTPAAAAAFQQVTLAIGVPEVGEPMSLAVLPDRSVLHTSRNGTLRITDAAGNTKVSGTLSVYSHDEEGLQGVGVDPGFATNRAIYLYYAPTLSTPLGDAPSDGPATAFAPYEGVNRLSQFTLNLDGTLNLTSERVVLDVPATRGICCHVGGDIDFDAAGNLYLSTGDDSNPFASDGYTPIDERSGRNPAYDAQRTSGNTNDLRGKLLRIKVAADGSYTVPSGNMFAPGTAGTRPEIYAMGFRNPFRMSVDKATGVVYLGDYGPDAGSASASRGPGGQVEFDRITGPGNYGWPYCTGRNDSYVDFTFPTGPSGATFNCAGGPTNNSPRNTGLTTLPAAQPAWLPYDGGSVPEFGSGSESPMGGPVYRYDAANPSDVKFPASYNGHFFAGEFGRQWIRDIEVTASGGVGAINTFPWSGKQVMDMAFGPDGALYVLDYGTSYFGGDANSALYRIDYVDGNRAPTAIASATPTSGALPLTVQFTGSGSADPDGDALSYAWDLDGNGTTDSTAVNPSRSYSTAGTYNAKLTVTDPGGKSGSANVLVTPGNTAPTVRITGPVNGSVINFGDTVSYQVSVTDPEDGTIDCSKVSMTYIFGHDLHGHPQTTVNGCSGTIATSADGEHDANANVFGVWRASYTDAGGLTGIAESKTQPSTRQAEHYSNSSGIALYDKTTARGGKTVGSINNGDWVSFTPYNLTGVTGFTARVSSNGAGGTLSLRSGSPTGTLLGSATVGNTGSWETFTEVSGAIAATTATSELYLVFTGGAGALYDVDEFNLTKTTTPPSTNYKVLVFSKTAGFRHSSIGPAITAIRSLGQANGFTVDATEDAAAFTTTNLAQYRAVVFLSTTGDVLNTTQQAAFESYIRGGGGYAGIHSAADTEYSWPWYGSLVGAYFSSHPANQQATITVEDRTHASTAHLGATWSRFDEWYNYGTNPRSRVNVLATLNESSYSGGTMGSDHPIAWCQFYDGGRSWYTGGGHTDESYAEVDFRAHLLGGIRYAAGVAGTSCGAGGVESGYTSLFNGSSTTGWSQAGPGSFTLSNGVLTSQGGLGMLWYSAQEFRSYSLKLDWQVEGDDNSGVFVGFPAGSDPNIAITQGYEIQIDPTDTADRTTGAIYGFKGADIAARDGALRPAGQWNTYEIVVEGQRLTVFLNNVKINEFTSTDPARDLTQGHIGIQNHGSGDTVLFRNIRIKELGTTGTTVTLQGESFAATGGVQPFNKPAARGGAVAGFIAAGDWIRYDGLDLTKLSRVDARVMPGEAPGTIEYRTGSPTGPLLGSAQVTATGNWSTFVDVGATTATSTATSLYLVFSGGAGAMFDVDEITLTSAAPPAGTTNLALSRPATATSVENASYPAGNAVDGIGTTRWSSAFADPQSITVDLGSARTVSRVKLVWEAAFGRSYTIATSPDGTTWTTRFTTTTGDGATDDITLATAATSTRYVRMAGTTRGTPYGYSLWELEVYGS